MSKASMMQTVDRIALFLNAVVMDTLTNVRASQPGSRNRRSWPTRDIERKSRLSWTVRQGHAMFSCPGDQLPLGFRTGVRRRNA